MNLAKLVYKNFFRCRDINPLNSWVRILEVGYQHEYGIGEILAHAFVLTNIRHPRIVYKDSAWEVVQVRVRRSVIFGRVMTLIIEEKDL